MTHRTGPIGLALGAVLVALGLAAVVHASAQNTNGAHDSFMGRRGGPGGPGFPGPGGSVLGPIQMLASQLGLTDTQKDQIKAIAESHRDEWKTYADHVRTARQALTAAITAGTFDEALIRDKSAALGQAEADLAVASGRAFAEIFPILTPDQQAKLKSLQTEMQQRGQQLRQRVQQFRQRARGGRA